MSSSDVSEAASLSDDSAPAASSPFSSGRKSSALFAATTSSNCCSELIRLSYLAFEVSIEPVKISSMLLSWLS